VYNTAVEDFTTFNPRMALILSPGSEVFKVMGGTAFRAPSPYEYFYTDGGISTIAPETLGPERILTTEVEWTHQFSQVLASTVSGYSNTISDLVDQADVGDVFQYANVEEPVRTVGAEGELRRSWRSGWMAAGQVSFQRTRIGSLSDGEPLVNSPDLLAAVMGAAPLGSQVTLASKVRAESRRLTRDGDYTPWACIMDITLTGEIPNLATTYGIGVRNLMDWPVQHPGGADLRQDVLDQPGRDFFGTVTVTF
jgi:outer membrane receptor for ferrienterochelin and colicins